MPHTYKLPYNQKMVFFACFISTVGLLASDFINPSLPYIMHNLAASQNATKGLMVVYLMALGLAQLFYGTYSDNHGRKSAIVLSFFIAIAGFILSALAHNIEMLYLARFITALGTAGSPVIARVIISDVCVEEAALKKGFSWFAMTSQLSPAIAPVLGGLIQQYSSWRVSFLVLACISLLSVLFLIKSLPESHTIPVIKKNWREQLQVYVGYLKIRQFIIFNLISSLILVFTFGYYTLSPFIFHQMGISPAVNGLLYISYAAGLVSGAFFLSHVLQNFDSAKTFTIIAFCYVLLGIIATVFFLHQVSILAIIIFSFTLAFICGVAAPLTLSLCLRGFQSNKGAASAVQGSMRYFFGGVVSLGFNFIVLHHFYQLAIIFLCISLVISLLGCIEIVFGK
jgi:DHA1 family bicyclomycin/chloramphenicol resistance-like MFS transporter